MATIVTDSNFSTLIAGAKPVMIDFWAAWCNPCRMLAPSIEALAAEYEGRAVVGKYNVDENSAVASQLGIRSIPAVLFFKGGRLVDSSIGLVPGEVLENKLKALL